MIAVQTVWVEMGYVEEGMRQMKSQVFLIWREERSSLRFLAIRGLRWQRRARSDLWRGGGLSHHPTGQSDLSERPLRGLLRPLCLQYLLLRRSHNCLRLHSRRLRQGLGLRV